MNVKLLLFELVTEDFNRKSKTARFCLALPDEIRAFDVSLLLQETLSATSTNGTKVPSKNLSL